jgi:sn1-specific diacylglycerol lipase
MCNTAAFLVTTHIARSDLFYASFHNQIFETPFIACADRDTNTIVVAIRGSLSLHDALTDLTVLDEDLPIDGDDSVLNADDVSVWA